MSGHDQLNVTPVTPIDEAKERLRPLSERILGEIAMIQRLEGHIEPAFREFSQNVKARLSLIRYDVLALEQELKDARPDLMTRRRIDNERPSKAMADADEKLRDLDLRMGKTSNWIFGSQRRDEFVKVLDGKLLLQELVEDFRVYSEDAVSPQQMLTPIRNLYERLAALNYDDVDLGLKLESILDDLRAFAEGPLSQAGSTILNRSEESVTEHGQIRPIAASFWGRRVMFLTVYLKTLQHKAHYEKFHGLR